MGGWWNEVSGKEWKGGGVMKTKRKRYDGDVRHWMPLCLVKHGELFKQSVQSGAVYMRGVMKIEKQEAYFEAIVVTSDGSVRDRFVRADKLVLVQ